MTAITFKAMATIFWRLGAASVGWWWGNVREATDRGFRNVQRELDAVAIDHEGHVMAVGSCKWTSGPMTHEEMGMLRRLASHIAHDGAEPDLYLFSRSGFATTLTREAEKDPQCHLIEVAAIGGAQPGCLGGEAQ
jgi:hypothetical protein